MSGDRDSETQDDFSCALGEAHAGPVEVMDSGRYLPSSETSRQRGPSLCRWELGGDAVTIFLVECSGSIKVHSVPGLDAVRYMQAGGWWPPSPRG